MLNEMYSMLVLAGGHSRRMGADKAELLLDGVPFWKMLADKGRLAGIDKIYLSRGSEEIADAQDVHLVYDRYPDRGPIAGMEAAFSQMETPYCLVVSVDVPQIPVEVLSHLLAAHQRRIEEGMTAGALVLEHEGRVQPLIGIYRTELWRKMEEAVREHGCPVFRMLDWIGCETDVRQVERWQVSSLNTPQEYQKVLGAMQEERRKTPCVIAVSGVKNSGKTTFLEKVVADLTKKGYKVAVIKHDGHDFVPDVEGTDTDRLRKAGACGCGIFSDKKWMVVKEEPKISEKKLIHFFPDADVILLEGFKNSDYPKIEIVRKDISSNSVCRADTLLALVTDTEIRIPGVPVLDLDDIGGCTEILCRFLSKQTTVCDMNNH